MFIYKTLYIYKTWLCSRYTFQHRHHVCFVLLWWKFGQICSISSPWGLTFVAYIHCDLWRCSFVRSEPGVATCIYVLTWTVFKCDQKLSDRAWVALYSFLHNEGPHSPLQTHNKYKMALELEPALESRAAEKVAGFPPVITTGGKDHAHHRALLR